MPTTDAMKDIIVKIMVEVLGIFAIVTKEIKQGRASESIPSNILPVADGGSERYLKKLIGRRDIEDALARLDRLTQEEVRMATTQVLKVAHRIEHGVDTVSDQVRVVDNRVKDVDAKVEVAIEGTLGAQALTSAVLDVVLTLRKTRWQGNKGSCATYSKRYGRREE